MVNLKKIIINIFVIIFFCQPYLYGGEGVQHGPFVKIFYAFSGSGSLKAPYNGNIIGTVESSAKEDTSSPYSGYKFSMGYFYNAWQSEYSYLKTDMKDQVIADNGQFIALKGSSKSYELKIGRRFFTPGDTSFGFLYIGGKKIELDIDLNDTSANGLGYIAGYYGFHSYGINRDFEFVFNYDFYIGAYNKSDISSNVDIAQKKKSSYATYLSFGGGAQYERYNISCLLKITVQADQITNKGVVQDEDVDFTAGSSGSFVGFEIIYTLPNYKYNLSD